MKEFPATVNVLILKLETRNLSAIEKVPTIRFVNFCKLLVFICKNFKTEMPRITDYSKPICILAKNISDDNRHIKSLH